MKMGTSRTKPPLGLIAGGGQFPIMCARAAQDEGRSVVAIAHKGETDKALEAVTEKIRWVHLGQLGKVIRFFKNEGVSEALFAGTITKKRIFRDVRPDIRALSIWRRLDTRLDDGILRAVAGELEKEGIRVVPSTLFLKGLLAPEGRLTGHRPSSSQQEDIEFGFRMAKEIGRLDIGQCLVVKGKAVLAVEAIEGTDETILRGGRLGGAGSVVVKICKPGQDVRFDLPSVGPRTIESMIRVKASVLVVEAGKTLLFDREDMIALADSNAITVIGR